MNEKVTPYIALVNPGDDNDTSPLILNPTNLLLFEKIKKDLNSDESLSQTLRLVATKKESEADIKYTIVKDGGEKATVINIPKDIEKTHPYTATEVVKKIKETLELSLGPDHGFTLNKFQDICRRKRIKEIKQEVLESAKQGYSHYIVDSCFGMDEINYFKDLGF